MKYTDETLNEYIDRQLPEDEEQRITEAIENDQVLRARVRELRTVRSLVRLSFSKTHTDGDEPPAKDRPSGLSGKKAIAASLFVALGALAGWLLKDSLTAGSPAYPDKQAVFLNTTQLNDLDAEEIKAILHVSTADPAVVDAALDEAERLLQKYRATHKRLELELIANASGLNILRADVSPQKRRLLELQARFDNFSLLACNKAIKRLQREKGINPKLLPGVKVVPSALDRILLRLDMGWAYIRA